MKTFARLVPYPDGTVRAEDIIQAASLDAISSMFMASVLDAWKAAGVYFEECPALDINGVPLEHGALQSKAGYENPPPAPAPTEQPADELRSQVALLTQAIAAMSPAAAAVINAAPKE